MKNKLFIYILVSLLFSCNILQAQNKALVGRNLAAYEGTWQYATSTDTFTLILKQGKKISPTGSFECLFGVHYYKKNGQVVDSYLNQTPPNQNNYTFEATNANYIEYYSDIDPNSLEVVYVDNNKQQDDWMDGRIDLNPNNPKEATWTLTEKEGEVLYLGEKPPPQDMSSTIPKTMILKKIK